MNIYKTSFLIIAVALISVTTISSAIAQVPSTARPSNIERQLRIEESRPDVGGAPVIVTPGEESAQLDSNLTFTLRSIEFEGLGAFSEEDLLPIYEDKIGQTITVGELNSIVNEITAFYRNQGYILSRAILPPQRIEGGDVKIRIVEGFVNQVILNGDIGSDLSPIHDYARKIKESKPLNAKTLERYLLLMEDLPGVTARAVLTPSADTPEASDVVVTVTRKQLEGAASLDNRGSRFLGPIQAGVTGSVNNIFGLDEQTQIRLIGSILQPEELKFFEIRHEQQIGSDGLKLVVSGSHVRTHPGFNLDSLNIEGNGTNFTAGISYPIIRSRQANWFVDVDVTSKQTDVDTLGADLYEDKLRMVNVGTSYDFVDRFAAVNRVEGIASQGFNIGTGRDQARSRLNGDTDFTKFFAKASRLQPVYGPFTAFVAASGQYAVDPLLAAEEFVIGGQEFGSAYDAAEITGDHGLAARGEVQYNDSANMQYLSEYQLYGFYDIGKVWNRNVLAASEPTSASLASAGAGARFNITDNISGTVEGAVPLTRNVAALGGDGNDARGFFSLLIRY